MLSQTTPNSGNRCRRNKGCARSGQQDAQLGGQTTSELSQRSVTQSWPCSGAMQSPVAQWHPVNVPSHTTAYAYLYLWAVGHTCSRRSQHSRCWVPQISQLNAWVTDLGFGYDASDLN